MTSKEEVQELMRSLLPVARKMLAEHGEFYPFGGYIDSHGKIVHVGVNLEGTDHPASKPLIELLWSKMNEEAHSNNYRATAVIYNVIIKLPNVDTRSDAIQVCLDHFTGYSIEVLFPYTIKENGEVVYGENFAQKGDNRVFKPDDTNSPKIS